jgi:Tfp pilus assembly protein PilV
MENYRRQPGFSLMETLLAVGTLAVGMLFIGGTFMTGIYFTGLSTERTIASVAADEAFAKIRLFGDPNMKSLSTTTFLPYDGRVRQRDKSGRTVTIIDEYLYPSTGETTSGQYSWAAICKWVNDSSRQVQFTVFVCRQSSAASKYWVRKTGAGATGFTASDLPRPVRVTITQDAASTIKNEVTIVDPVAADGIDECAFVNDGASIVDDATGQIYRVLERSATQPDRIKLDRPWAGGAITPPAGGGVWVVPPPTVGGRDPLVAIYQKVIRF